MFVAVLCDRFFVNVFVRRFDIATGGLGSTWDVRLVILLSDCFAGLMEGGSGTWQDNQAESESDKRWLAIGGAEARTQQYPNGLGRAYSY